MFDSVWSNLWYDGSWIVNDTKKPIKTTAESNKKGNSNEYIPINQPTIQPIHSDQLLIELNNHDAFLKSSVFPCWCNES